MAEFTPVSSNILCAVAKATNPWGGVPQVLGALDGFEAAGWNMDLNQALIPNEGWTGTLDPGVSSPGPRTPGGTIPFDLYYEDTAWRFLTALMGSESVANPAAGAYDHDLIPVSTHAGMNLTVAALFPTLYVRQLDFSKISGGKITFDQGASRTRAEATLTAFDDATNQGAVTDNLVVTSVALANGALTIAAQPPVPQILTVTITAGPPTEAIITIRGYNEFGKPVTHVHQFTLNGLTGSTTEYFSQITFATVSGLVGAGNVKIGVTNGRGNTLTTMASVTKHAVRSPILFHHVQVFLGLQSQAGALDNTNLINVETVEIERILSVNTRITTEFGYRQSEPATGGQNHASTKVSIKFGALTDVNNIQMWRRRAATALRMMIVCTGNHLATVAFQEGLTIWLQGLQSSGGEPKPSGQGVIPFDLELMGSIVSSTPTGWPASVLAPMYMRLRNAQSGTLL